jgi:hypothetical protein
MSLTYNPLSSVPIFENLPVFFTLYNVWIMLVVFLLVKTKGTLHHILLLSLFSSVFLGFWIALTPFGQSADSAYQMGHLQYILTNGHIDPTSHSLGYFQTPGFAILTASFAQLLGLEVFATGTFFLLFSVFAFTFLVYAVYRQFIKNSTIVPIAVIFLIQGNLSISLSQDFHPQNLAFLFFASFLLLLLPNHFSLKRQLLFVILFTSLVTVYASLSFGLLFIFFALIIISVLNKSDRDRSNTISMYLKISLVSIIIFVIWGIYQESSLFISTAQLIPEIFIGGFQERTSWLFNVGRVNLGQQIPFWANFTRLFWLAIVFGLGGFISLLQIRKGKLDQKTKKVFACIVGCLAFGFFAFIISPGGNQFYRILLYTPFLMVPIILGFFAKRKSLLSLALIVLIIMSFPTFLVNNSRVSYSTIYPTEVSAGNFLADSYGTGTNVQLFSTIWCESFTYLKTYNAMSFNEGDIAYTSIDQYWHQVNLVLNFFENNVANEKIFIRSDKFGMASQHLLSISPSDPKWIVYMEKLSQNNQIYSNGKITFYAP